MHRLPEDLLERTADEPGAVRLHRVLAHLAHGDGDPEGVRAAVAALTPADLEPFGLPLFRLNFLAAFGPPPAPGAVPDVAPDVVPDAVLHHLDALAVEAARRRQWREWAFGHYVALNAAAIRSRIAEGETIGEYPRTLAWDDLGVARLRALVRPDRGVVVAIPHVGEYRHVPSDLAALGFHVTNPLIRATVRRLDAVLQEGRIRRFTLVDAEDRATPIVLAKVLRRGGLVTIFTDGNGGADGFFGDEGRTTTHFLGHRVRVKTGAARLAATFGAPLVPVLAGPDPHAPVVVGAPLDPGGSLRDAAREAWAAEATRTLYTAFEAHVRAHPADWETGLFFHRWRVVDPPNAAALGGAAVEAARRWWAPGRGRHRVRLAHDRVAQVPTRDGPAWVEVGSLQSTRVPPWLAPHVGALRSPDGLALEALTAAAPAPAMAAGSGDATGAADEERLATLAQLWARGYLRVSEVGVQ